ncbi:MAG: sarcosine oxidase subunit delta [Rhodobacteraceae bacterium]|nr:sarcosine oxidase subunit delta [Paracoccaceae bacterium]
MRITCPHCGPRDLREFTYRGASLPRPASDAAPEAWDAYLHLRDNPAGPSAENWFHNPCATWLLVKRDTVSHAVYDVGAANPNPNNPPVVQ